MCFYFGLKTPNIYIFQIEKGYNQLNLQSVLSNYVDSLWIDI